jgi:outer membrane protein assembly factor BamB
MKHGAPPAGLLLAAPAGLLLGLLAAAASDTDWPMWGGAPGRNMVSAMSGLPEAWDVHKKQNVKWTAGLGSQTYGSPVVAGGRVYIGTNNDPPRDPKTPGDRGVLLCLRESDGRFLWQHTHPKLDDDSLDWPETGLCSTPLVEAGRVYYVSNRGEVVCLDAQGDGAGRSKLIWSYDMRKELGVVPHHKFSSSPAAHGDLVYVSTSNGADESGEKVPNPKAPTIIALDKTTGKLAWKANGLTGRLYDGQWSSPAAGVIGGVAQVVIGEGDGWVRGYAAAAGEKLWEFNTNPKGSTWPATAGIVIAAPVILGGRVYIANGQDPEGGEGPGHLYAIDATRRGDISESGRVWQFSGIRRSISSVAIHDGLLFAADLSGYVHCLDAGTGKPYWKQDQMAGIWASPAVIGGKVYLGNADGDVYVLEASRELKVLFQANMGGSVYSPVVPANGALFIATRDKLFAVQGIRP